MPTSSKIVFPKVLAVTAVNSTQLDQYSPKDKLGDLGDVGQFGFQNAEQFNAFLRSENGKVVQAIMLDNIIEQEKITREQQLAIQHEMLKHRYFLAMLLLGLLHHKAANAKLNREALEQIEEKKHKAENASKSRQESLNARQPELDSYQKQFSSIQHELNRHLAKAADLEHTLDKLARDEQHMNLEHEMFDLMLDNVDSMKDDDLNQLIENSDKIEQHHHDMIQELLASGQDEDAMLILAQLKAHLIRRAAATERTDQHLRYDATLNPIQGSPSNLVYTLPKAWGLQLVKDPDSQQLLLIPHNKKPNNLTVEEKQQAKSLFTQKEAEMVPVKSSINQRKQLEKEAFEARSKPLYAKAAAEQQQLELLQTQQSDLQSSISQLSSASTTKAGAPIPVPRPDRTSSYRLFLQTIRNHPTPQHIKKIKKDICETRGRELEPDETQFLSKIRPDMPMRPDQMRRLLELLADSAKGMVLQNLEVKNTPTTAPTPFNTHLNPMKNPNR